MHHAANLQLQLLGYADRAGNEAGNLALSQRRAEAVREVLVSAGIPADAVSARGMGESASVDCGSEPTREARLACMAPDRRVEIVAQGEI